MWRREFPQKKTKEWAMKKIGEQSKTEKQTKRSTAYGYKQYHDGEWSLRSESFREKRKQALMSLEENLMNIIQEIIMLILSYGY